MGFTILRRSHIVEFLKVGIEGRAIVYSRAIDDFKHCKIGSQQQPRSVCTPAVADVVVWRVIRAGLEPAVERAHIHTQLVGEFVGSEFIFVSHLVEYHLAHALHELLIFTAHLSALVKGNVAFR